MMSKKLLIALCIMMAAAPAVAADKDALALATKAMSACTQNIASSSKAQKAVQKFGLSEYSKAPDTTTFANPDQTVVMAVSNRTMKSKVCFVMVEKMRLREANKFGNSLGKSLGMQPLVLHDKAFSVAWGRIERGKDLTVLVQKKREIDLFTGPAIMIILLDQ